MDGQMPIDAAAMRDSLKLDFGAPGVQIPNAPNTSDLLSAILKSPEFERLSRDLESTFKAQSFLPTPTPTKMLFPQEVSNEQKQYAQGFIDALKHVQRLNGFVEPLSSPSVLDRIPAITSTFSPKTSPLATRERDFEAIMNAINLTHDREQRDREMNGFKASTSSPTTSSSSSNILPSSGLLPLFNPTPTDPRIASRSSNPSTQNGSDDSDVSDSSLSLPSSSSRSARTKKDLNGMDDQEAKKLERKRLRNRQAASKCRQKKLMRISELETMVNAEKELARKLDYDLDNLRKQVRSLEAAIQIHQQHGCTSHV